MVLNTKHSYRCKQKYLQLATDFDEVFSIYPLLTNYSNLDADDTDWYASAGTATTFLIHRIMVSFLISNKHYMVYMVYLRKTIRVAVLWKSLMLRRSMEKVKWWAAGGMARWVEVVVWLSTLWKNRESERGHGSQNKIYNININLIVNHYRYMALYWTKLD